MDLSVGLQFAEEHKGRVRDELEQIIAKLQAWANHPNTEGTGYATFAQPQCRYYLQNGASQTIADNTITPLQWSNASNEVRDEDFNAVQFDNGASFGHKFLQADGLYLIPPVPGRYLVTAGVAFQANAVGRRVAVLTQRMSNGTSIQIAVANQFVVDTSDLAYLHLAAVLVVPEVTTAAVGVGLQVQQTSGGDLDVWPGVAQTYISMLKVS